MLLQKHQRVKSYLETHDLNVSLKEIYGEINKDVEGNPYDIYITDEDLIIRNTTYPMDKAFDLNFEKEIFRQHYRQNIVGCSTPIREKKSDNFLSYTDSYIEKNGNKKATILEISYTYTNAAEDIKNIENLIEKFPRITSAKAYSLGNEGFTYELMLKRDPSYTRTSEEIVLAHKKAKQYLLILKTNDFLQKTHEKLPNLTPRLTRALVRRLRAKLQHDIIENIIENIIEEGYSISQIPPIEKRSAETNIDARLALLEEENSKLKVEKEVLLKRSTTDALTGLYNRVKIQEIFLYEQKQFIRYGDELSVILMDLDDFKSVNDTHGHNIGDKYLQTLSQSLGAYFRTVDIIGRWGGEEFIVLLPKTSLFEAKEKALEVRDIIKEMDCSTLGSRTASFGVTTLVANDTLSTFVGRADEALLQAKAKGKDRVDVQY